jgi:type IV pilus assembly protein PilM
LFAIKRDTVNRYLQHFNDVGVEVNVVQMSPLALCNFVSFDLLNKGGSEPAPPPEEEDEASAGKKKCVVALDIGTDNSNLVITDAERIIWQRPIPLGGNHFTRALTKDLKLTFAKAEHLKRNATKSPDLKKILVALRPELNDFVGEVQRSLSYFTNTHKDAHVKYMVGLGNAFRLPGLQKFLSEKLQLEVRKLTKMNRLEGDSVVTAPSYTENVLSFAVAYGLALQGLKVTRLQTNLLPHEIRFDRLIRAKKPWAAAAAAVLLFGASTWTLSYALEYRRVAHDVVKDAIKKGEAVTQRAAGYRTEYENKEKEIEKNVTAVKSILAGSGERYNWLSFMQFLSEALPRPDGSNLLDEKTEKAYWPAEFPLDFQRRGKKSIKEYYLTDAAKLAYKKFFEQETGATATKDKDDEDLLEDLIQVNVISAVSLYTDNLGTFFTRLMNDREASQFKKTMRQKDVEKPPEGKGWVVELRGYTYHKDQIRFLEYAMLRNLASHRLVEAPGAAAVAPAKDGVAATTQPATPAGQPASGDGQPTGAADDKNQENVDPVWGRVSHVVLYRVARKSNPDGQNYSPYITTSHLGALVGLAGAAGAGATAGPQVGTVGPGSSIDTLRGSSDDSPATSAGPTGSRRDSWEPLSATGLGRGAGGIGTGAGLSDTSIRGSGDISIGTPDVGTIGGFPSTTTAPEKPVAGKPKLTRTEFVIILIWKEPTPSDDLLGTGEDPLGGAMPPSPGVAPPPPPPPPPGGGGGGATSPIS